MFISQIPHSEQSMHFQGTSMPESKYEVRTLINEIILLAFMVSLEAVRLILGQKHQRSDFRRDMFAVFRIIVLTVPSMYAVAYFAFWQNFVTRLDLSLGVIMLIIQGAQVVSSFTALVLNFMAQMRAGGGRQQ